MRNIRKGNDIHIKWAIVINDGDIALSSVNLTIEIRDARGRLRPLPHRVVEDRYVEFDYYGTEQMSIGEHTLIAWMDKGKKGQAVIDQTNAFCLVDSSDKVGGTYNNTNVVCETLELSSQMVIGLRGLSAYECWLEAGHRGTEEDFLKFIKGAQGDKGDKGDTVYVNVTADIDEVDGHLLFTVDDSTSFDAEINNNGHLIVKI